MHVFPLTTIFVFVFVNEINTVVMAMASGAMAAAETAVAGNRPVAGKTAAASTVGQQTAEAVLATDR